MNSQPFTGPLRRQHRPPDGARSRVSVVIPLYNYGHFLTECVDSILGQEGVDVDVLIIDDASTDDSLTVARRLAAADDRVSVVANSTNRGMIPSINDGLWAVDGEYIVKFDADDVLPPGALARATALLDTHPSVGFAYGFPVAFTTSPPPPAKTKVRSWTVWHGHDWIRTRCQRGGNVIMQPEVVMRATALREAGKYRPELPHGSDFDMWMRLAAVADVGRINGAHQGYYRVHANSMQRTVNAGHVTDLEAHCAVWRNLFRDYGETLPDAAQLETMAWRSVALTALDRAFRAYDGGRAAEEPIESYVALAAAVHPDIRRARRWRALQRRLGHDAYRPERMVSARFQNLRRNLWDRVEWRRWRWNGV